jgi:hypothetical protein
MEERYITFIYTICSAKEGAPRSARDVSRYVANRKLVMFYFQTTFHIHPLFIRLLEAQINLHLCLSFRKFAYSRYGVFWLVDNVHLTSSMASLNLKNL